MIFPADDLEGKELPRGWIVDQKVVPRPNSTGGKFSTGYFVHNSKDGRQGFLKAMDYTAAFQAPNTIDELKIMADSYTFERDICLLCSDSGINRVVHAIDYGTFEPGAAQQLGPFGKVEYLIFERADGDIRGFLDQQQRFDVAFALRTLHGTAAALQQLHNAAMAHQDLKPSNILIFGPTGRSKLGDLGRAWAKGLRAPHDDMAAAGDLGYAPLELLLGEIVDEETKRFGYDMYLLGSLAVFLFTRVHMNALVVRHLDNSFRPSETFPKFSEILPYLQEAFPKALHDFSLHVPELVRIKLSHIVARLCDPDPNKRGDTDSLNGNRFSLERYVSAFDFLRSKAEIHLRSNN